MIKIDFDYRLIDKIDEKIWKAKKEDIAFTLIDSEKILDFRELEIAAYLVASSFGKNSISDRIENEFLIKLSGIRQIKDAIKEYGAKKNKESILVYFGDEGIEKFTEKYSLKVNGKFDKKTEEKELFKKMEEKTISLIKD
ncbi:MAG: KEOPS complex subunit Cgi121 [Candidatus Anstonellaceae archaeon]